MSLLFGYASDLELVEENVDMDGNRIIDLPEPTTDSEPVTKGKRYVDREVTRIMFLNNVDFYDDVRERKFDVRLFERSFKKRKWCPLQVIGFLAFGRVLEDVDVTGLLAKWVPNFKAQFWWFVVKNHLLKG